MFFIPDDDDEYENVYFVTPQGRCYKQDFANRGKLEHVPRLHQNFQADPW